MRLDADGYIEVERFGVDLCSMMMKVVRVVLLPFIGKYLGRKVAYFGKG
jgi:hypothetical protein